MGLLNLRRRNQIRKVNISQYIAIVKFFLSIFQFLFEQNFTFKKKSKNGKLSNKKFAFYEFVLQSLK
jgi:hypothetical protein